MDKYEYNLKFDQIKSLCAEENYDAAAEIADTINWSKIRNVNALVKAGEVYEKVQRYEESREILLMAYDRSPIGRMIIYRLAEVALKMGATDEAEEYYKEFVQIAPHDSLKYVLRYEIIKAKGGSYVDQIHVLEEFKEQEYTEEWSYELAFLYHKAGMVEKCVETCDELILWFGDGPYVERALELKMLYQPLTKAQEEKYRAFRMSRDGITMIKREEMEQAGEYGHTPVNIPQVSLNPERFNTVNLQEEIAKGIQQIMDATEQETVSDTMDSIKKIVEDIPYLQIAHEESRTAEEEGPHIETDEEIDGSLRLNFQELLNEEADGQIGMVVDEQGQLERQITGQMTIADVLEEWEKTKHAAEVAMQEAEQRKLESAKARALQEAGDIMDRLTGVLPQLDAGVAPVELLQNEYMSNEPVAEAEPKEEPMPSLMTELEPEEDLEEDSKEDQPEEPHVYAAGIPSFLSGYGREEVFADETPAETEIPMEADSPEGNQLEDIGPTDGPSTWEFEGTDEDRLSQELTGREDDQLSQELAEADEAQLSQELAEGDEAQLSQVLAEADEAQVSQEFAETKTEERAEYEEWQPSEEVSPEPEIFAKEKIVVASDEELPADMETPVEPETEEEPIAPVDEATEEQDKAAIIKQTTSRMPDIDLTGSENDIMSRKTKRIPEVQLPEDIIEDLAAEALEREVEKTEAMEKPAENLTPEQKAIFSYFVPVKGMESQLCNAISGISSHLKKSQTASSGNLIIQGGRGCGKTVLATSMIKVLQKETGKLKGKVGKISGEALSRKDIHGLLQKVSGGCLIIERAGELTKEAAIKLGLLLQNDQSGLMVILEDTSPGIKKALSLDDKFASHFTEKINVPIFTSDELVAFAKSYSEELGYEIDEVAVLALYNRISRIQRLDQATTLTEVKEIVDEAIERERHGGLKKAFSIITASRYTKDDRILLREKDFE